MDIRITSEDQKTLKLALIMGLRTENDGWYLDIPEKMFKSSTVVHFGKLGEYRCQLLCLF